MSPRSPYKHHDTPKRAKLRGTIAFLKHHDLLGQKKGQVSKEAVYSFFGISRTQAKDIQKSRLELPHPEPVINVDEEHLGTDPDARTLANDPRFPENRHGHVKFGIMEAMRVDDYLEKLHREDSSTMFEMCRQPWTAIAGYAGVEIHDDDGEPTIDESTIAKKMRQLNWHSCEELEKAGNDDATRENRLQRANIEIEKGHWNDPVWRARVYCTDEWHFSFQREEPSKIKRKPHHTFANWTVKEQSKKSRLRVASPDDEYYSLPIITVTKPYKPRKLRNGRVFKKKEPPEQSVIHCVVALGLNYKSPMYWYEVQSNDNGKMDVRTYKEVYKRVFDDIEKHHGSRDFIVWEDGDGSHIHQETCDWKAQNTITTITNAHYCPETSPVEDCKVALVTKSYIRRHAHWSLGQLRGLAEKGWESVKKEDIARIYEDMP